MTQNEVEQLICDALEKQGFTNVSFKQVVMGENSIRASVVFKRDVGGGVLKDDFKELIVLRMGGSWRVLL